MTRGKLDFEYGLLEARIKLPRGQGVRPAFCLLGSDTETGEIDIIEIGDSGRDYDNSIHGPLDADAAREWEQSHDGVAATDLSADYHIYQVYREPGFIMIGIDGEPVGEYRISTMPAGARWVFSPPLMSCSTFSRGAIAACVAVRPIVRGNAHRLDQVLAMNQPLGFGCASLYGLPARRDRRTMLEVAYGLGIRHFDVAPMYGLGLAETELADFLKEHDDVMIATKFGIRLTAIGMLAGVVQRPVRLVLQKSSSTRMKIKASGSGPIFGAVGHLLYSGRDYSVGGAQRALYLSMRALRTERIDCYFLLHEPVGALAGAKPLADFLDAERQRGVIGHWGPAGDLSRMDTNVTELTRRASAVQYPYDLITGYGGRRPPIRRDIPSPSALY